MEPHVQRYLVWGVSLLYYIFVTAIALFSESQVNRWPESGAVPKVRPALRPGPDKAPPSMAAASQHQSQFFSSIRPFWVSLHGESPRSITLEKGGS